MLHQGGAEATNVNATIFWSPPPTLITPEFWTLVGNVVIPNVPTGDILTVSIELFVSADIPVAGHYCFLGLLNAQDPAPDPADFLNWDHFTRFIRDNNNVTWKNFNIRDNDPDVDPSVPKGFLLCHFLRAWRTR
ncbi:MAG: hypothetical protein IPK08_18740 [Bacteroidetes bacterium]|nr:hypothetical protein [Bacteroidota bacterium]